MSNFSLSSINCEFIVFVSCSSITCDLHCWGNSYIQSDDTINKILLVNCVRKISPTYRSYRSIGDLFQKCPCLVSYHGNFNTHMESYNSCDLFTKKKKKILNSNYKVFKMRRCWIFLCVQMRTCMCTCWCGK